MVCRVLARLVALSPLLAPGAHAQAPGGAVASVEVAVTDATSGRPVPRVLLYNWRRQTGDYWTIYSAGSETTGVARLDSVPAGVPQRLIAECSAGAPRVRAAKTLDTTTVVLRPGEVRRWAVRSSAAWCDAWPFRVVRGTFAGHWSSGFERSRFVPCDGALPAAWARLEDSALPVAWPRGGAADDAPYFVRFEGTLRGPWHYGHLGVSPYELAVSRVVEIRRRGRADCP